MATLNKISLCLWFDSDAADAANFYTSIFKNSKILKTSHYTDAGREVHGRPAGSVMTVEFEMAGQHVIALNGGPHFKFNEAISLHINCDSQEEVDYFWSKLTSGGGEEVQCGWLKDKFGVSWQVVPTEMNEFLSDPDPKKSGRAMEAMLKMKKLDINELKRAVAG